MSLRFSAVLLFCLCAHFACAQTPPASDSEQALAKLEAALARKVSLSALDMPFKDAIADLAKQAQVQIRLTKKIEDAGVEAHQPVTISLRDVPLRTCLRNLLDRVQLTYVIGREVISVTTPEDASSVEHLLIRVYPVKDLIPPRKPGEEFTYDYQRFGQLITNTIDFEGWQVTGGSSALSAYEQSGSIAVTASYEVHRQVAGLLAALRQAKALQGAKAEAGKIPCWIPLGTPEEQETERQLQAVLSKTVSYKFEQEPLNVVLAKISKDVNVQILASRKIEDAGVQPDQPITIDLEKVSLRSFFSIMLTDLNLSFHTRDELIRVTTIEDIQSPENMEARVYPVRDLIEYVSADGKPPILTCDPLIDLITSTVEPDSWDETLQGREGSEFIGALVIAQRKDLHEIIAHLLTSLRKTRANNP